MGHQPDILSVQRVIAAPAEQIFDVIADPSRHADFDGSNSVQALAGDSPARLFLGATFEIEMKLRRSYTMLNTVTEFDENRRIAWSPKLASGKWASLIGRIWRYELERVGGGTSVTETWDFSKEGSRFMLRHTAIGRMRKSMQESLELLEAIVTSA